MAKIRTLRRCKLFRTLNYRDLAVLAASIKEESAKAQSWLAEEGKPSQGLVILKSGKIRVISKGAQGAEIVLGPDEFFGELSLGAEAQPRGVGAQALESCEYLRLGPEDYIKLAADAPDVAGKIARGVLEITGQKVHDLKEWLSHQSLPAGN